MFLQELNNHENIIKYGRAAAFQNGWHRLVCVKIDIDAFDADY